MKKVNFFILFGIVFGLAVSVPTYAQAADCPVLAAGNVFKVKGHTAVYLLDDNLKRLYFPNSEVYHSWYDNFSQVVEIPETCVDNYPTPLDPPFGVNFRPGSRLVKVKISPTVYVIEPGNKLRKLGSEAVARELYGANWAGLVRDIADAFWPNFKDRGPEVAEAKPHDGMFLRTPGEDGVYYVESGELKKLEDTSNVEADDIRVVGRGVFSKLAVRAGLIESKRAFLKPDQKDEESNGSVDEVDNIVVTTNTVEIDAVETESKVEADGNTDDEDITADDSDTSTINANQTATSTQASTGTTGTATTTNDLILINGGVPSAGSVSTQLPIGFKTVDLSVYALGVAGGFPVLKVFAGPPPSANPWYTYKLNFFEKRTGTREVTQNYDVLLKGGSLFNNAVFGRQLIMTMNGFTTSNINPRILLFSRLLDYSVEFDCEKGDTITFHAEVDYQNQVIESNENNNVKTFSMICIGS